MIFRGTEQSGAHFSDDGKYRYALYRQWGKCNKKHFTVIGLNPSTADENIDDPTIRRCIGFAKREGCTGLTMLNLFAYRATDPNEMVIQHDPVGPENDIAIAANVQNAIVIAAWGALPFAVHRARKVMEMIPTIQCFGLTKNGHPKHPLYLKLDTPIIPYVMQ